jgi:calcium-dependent protein kinase
MNRTKLLSKKNLQIAFEAFDKDESGSISVYELKEALGASTDSDQVWEQIINEIDLDKNGEVDLQEFTEMMIKLF